MRSENKANQVSKHIQMLSQNKVKNGMLSKINNFEK